MPSLILVLVIAYPVVLHLGIRSGNIEYAVFLLAILLSTGMLIDGIKRQRPSIKSVVGIVIAAVLIFLPPLHEQVIIKTIPVFIFSSLFLLFVSSLKSDETPLITRIATIIRKGVVSDKVFQYTRWVTIVWSAYFFIVALVSIYMGIFSNLESWSIFTNFISYLLLIPLFVIEFIFRSYYLRDEMEYGVREYIKGLVRVNYRDVFR